MMLLDTDFQPDLDSLLKAMFGCGIEVLQGTNSIWIEGKGKRGGKNLNVCCWRMMQVCRENNWQQAFIEVFSGVIMTFSLAQQGALQFHRERMHEVQKHFCDDVKMIIIASLRPGEKRMISKNEMKDFIQEHGNPPYFEWRYKQKFKMNQCIEDFVFDLKDIQTRRKSNGIKPSKCSLFLTKCSQFFTKCYLFNTDLLKTMGID